MTANFTLVPGATGVTGHPLVQALWTTDFRVGEDHFLAEPGAAYDVVVGPEASLYALNNNTSGAANPGNSVVRLYGGSLTNYGTLNAFPNVYPDFYSNGWYNNTQPVVTLAGDGSTLINRGTMGFQPPSGNITVNTVNIWGATNTRIDNYGLMVGLHNIYGGGANTIAYNHAGAKMVAWFGTPMEFNAAVNLQDGGLMNDIQNGSYCFHLSYQTASNWGYCIASANGFWLDQRNAVGYDYGGPLVPASHDLDGNLVFNGNLTGDFAYNKYQCVASAASTPILAINNAKAYLNNTVYTVAGTGRLVNYLPLTFGYPMLNAHDAVGTNNGALVFTLSHLTAAQQAQISAQVAASQRSYVCNGVTYPNVYSGSFTLYGHSYSYLNFGTVSVNFTDTIVGDGINGVPTPGVWFTKRGARAFFTDNTSADNPYYYTNAATVRLAGSIAEPKGRLTIEPGWTLQLGSFARVLDSNNVAQANPLNAAFASAPALHNSIEIQAGQASTPDNVDGTVGKTATLYGALVIDNPSTNVVLPNLVGGGWLVQSGTAVTTLSGLANKFTGTLFLANGTLAIGKGAAFKPAPELLIGQNDTSLRYYPVFDISGFGTGVNFTLGRLAAPGPQIQVVYSNNSTGLIYPVIRLGANTLVVGDGRTASGWFGGGLQGTGGLVIAKGTSFTMALPAPNDACCNNPRRNIGISTYSGGTSVQAEATLIQATVGGFGTGPIVNAGTVALASGNTYAYQYNLGTQQAGVPGAAAAPHHTFDAPAGYTQAATGTLRLRVMAADAKGSAGAGAGKQYDRLTAVGTATLDGTLELNFLNGVAPAKGSSLTVVQAGAVSGKFARVKLVGVTGVRASQTVSGNSVVVTFQ